MKTNIDAINAAIEVIEAHRKPEIQSPYDDERLLALNQLLSMVLAAYRDAQANEYQAKRITQSVEKCLKEIRARLDLLEDELEIAAEDGDSEGAFND